MSDDEQKAVLRRRGIDPDRGLAAGLMGTVKHLPPPVCLLCASEHETADHDRLRDEEADRMKRAAAQGPPAHPQG